VRAQELIAGCDYKVVTSAPGHEPLPPPVPFAPALAPSISHR